MLDRFRTLSILLLALCAALLGATAPARALTPTPAPGLPDLTISGMSISYQGTACSPGPLGLRVSVTNIGTADAGPFAVRVNNSTQTLPGLEAGRTVAVWFSSFYTSGPNSATADPSTQVGESNEANTQRTPTARVPTPPACTPTLTNTPSRTPSPTPTPTATPTPTFTPTATPASGGLKVPYWGLSRTTKSG